MLKVGQKLTYKGNDFEVVESSCFSYGNKTAVWVNDCQEYDTRYFKGELIDFAKYILGENE